MRALLLCIATTLALSACIDEPIITDCELNIPPGYLGPCSEDTQCGTWLCIDDRCTVPCQTDQECPVSRTDGANFYAECNDGLCGAFACD